MDYVDHDLKYQDEGTIVEVRLNQPANVYVIDQVNYNIYAYGEDPSGYGGYITSSPFRIRLPYFAHWHVCIDMGFEGGVLKDKVIIYHPSDNIRKVLHEVLPDRGIAYFNQFANGQLELTSIVRDGMERFHGNKIFNSLPELLGFADDYRGSKY